MSRKSLLHTIITKYPEIGIMEAKQQIEVCRKDLHNRIAEGDFCGADDILLEYFGLEADWLDELI